MGRRPRTVVAPGVVSSDALMVPRQGFQVQQQQQPRARFSAPAPSLNQSLVGLRLHIGCGTRRLVGWINADAVPGVGDAVVDLQGELPQVTYREIYGSHVLEHCWPQDTPGILRRLFTALLPGGTLRLSVPDLRLVVKNCVDAQIFGDETAALSVLYGGNFSRTTSAPDLHRQAFWRERLERLLKEAGFVNIREWGPGQYPAIDVLRDWATWPRDGAGRSSISLNMEADRPGTLQPLAPGADGSLKLLVRMPTRSRPAQALDVLAKYRGMAGTEILLEVVVDADDATMAAPDVRRRLDELGCTVTVGNHKSKIQAVNGGCVNEWDVLLLASDDMVPIKQGYAVRVLEAMAQYFPQLDGAVYFDDNYAGQKLCTLPIMGRRLYDQFGYVYHPDYMSFFCDNEQTEVLQVTKRLVYVDERLIEHRHFANKAAPVPMDALYQANNVMWNRDKVVYEKRRMMKQPYAQTAFDAPPMWLSLLIATVPSRRDMLKKLLDFLYAQMQAFPREVEIIVDPREGITIGAKRNAMVARSIGYFVAHIDDDDWVADDYVSRVIGALKTMPDADCADLYGVMSTNGAGAAPFKHSICYTQWGRAANGLYERTPEHRNAVRRDLAAVAGFPDISFGEDHEFSKKLRPLLKKEVSTGTAPLYYYRYQQKAQSWYPAPGGK